MSLIMDRNLMEKMGYSVMGDSKWSRKKKKIIQDEEKETKQHTPMCNAFQDYEGKLLEDEVDPGDKKEEHLFTSRVRPMDTQKDLIH